MKWASFVVEGRATFGMIEGTKIRDVGSLAVGGINDLRSAIACGMLEELAGEAKRASALPLDNVAWLPVIPNPDKILCIGLNYETHRLEAGRPEVAYPAVFFRLPSSQVGHRSSLVRPRVSEQLDFEGELALIIGKGGRYIRESAAFDHIAGYACYNDGTIRDWQRHTHQFTPGKTFPNSGSFGPYMITTDAIPDVTALTLTTRLNGQLMQMANVSQLIFSIPRLIAYCSAFTRLEPGDVICTGTPGGVGFKRTPPVFMQPGDTIEVEIDGVGKLVNGITDERDDLS